MLDKPRFRIACTAIFVALTLAACGQSIGQPPLAIEFRDSMVQLGQIVRLTNSGSQPLTGLKVKVTNPNGDVKHHSEASLAPGETLEVGWKKLDGFQVEHGARVSVRCDGYLLPFLAKLAAESDSGGLVNGD